MLGIGKSQTEAKHTMARLTGGPKNEFGLELSVSVRANFTVQINFFVLRCGPFHGSAPWVRSICDAQTISQGIGEGNRERPHAKGGGP